MRKTKFLIAILAMVLTLAGGAMADEPEATKGKTESKGKDKGKDGDKSKDKGGSSDKGKDKGGSSDKGKDKTEEPDPDYKSDPVIGDHLKGG